MVSATSLRFQGVPGVVDMNASLLALRSIAARDPEARLLVTQERQLSAAETLDAVERMAEVLAANDVGTLALAADNSPDWVIADLAAQMAGVPLVPVPPFFSAGQVVHALADSGVDAIAADEPGSVALLSLPTRFTAELSPDLTLLRLKQSAVVAGVPAGTAKISYTSGTTGTPRGVCLPQPAMDRVAKAICAATADLGIRRHLCLLPLATLLENISGVYAPLIAGAEIALPPIHATGLLGAAGLDVDRLLECLQSFEPESVILLPQLLESLVGAVERGASLPESLRFAAVGGGVVGLPLLERADRVGVPVYEGYGLTECCSVVALNTPDARRPGSVGRPLPHCHVRIGKNSEVLVSGNSMRGYLGSERAHAGEIATGDIGHMDADGYLYIDGRIKNVMITSFGRNLSPEWVESCLTAKPSIAQAALFGDGMPFNVAIVVPAANAGVDTIECDIAEVNRRLPDYARIGRWFLAAEPFSPIKGTATSNGRIRRPVIRNRYQDEIDACYADAFESYA